MKRIMVPAVIMVAVMLGLPWLTVQFVPGDAGMAVCFALFFAVDPLLAVGMGVLAGLRRQWWWPPCAAVTFVLGTWLAFSPGEKLFLLYAGVYLAIGLAAMGLTWLVRRMTKER